MFSRSGYSMTSWRSAGYVTYKPGTTITITDSLDLDAMWSSNFTYVYPTPKLNYNELPSPIILDLDGNGVRTTNVENGVIFSYEGDNNRVRTAWADPNCGLLARDLNGNGQIDNAAELFGNYTILENGEKASNGFIALKELDLNQDGTVDREEAEKAGIFIWIDANTNAAVDPGEYLTFEEAGVLSIDTNYKVRNKTDENGNVHRWLGKFTRSDGSKAAAEDILFMTVDLN